MSRYSKIWEYIGRIDTIGSLLGSDIFKQWLAPLLAPMLTLGFGFFSSVPIPYLILACFASFSFAMNGLLRYSQWRQLVDPSGRLKFEHPMYYFDTNNKNGELILEKVQFGATINNTFSIPLNYEVEFLQSNFAGRINKEAHIPYRNYIDGNAMQIIRSVAINLNPSDLVDNLDGIFEFRISYWLSENKKYFVERKLKISARYYPLENQYKFEYRFAI